jgi:hypothetical protein
MLSLFGHTLGRGGAPVRGHRLPRRRFTGWAAVYFLAFVALPVLALGLALDALFYALSARAGSCYAIFCLFD